MPRSLLPARKRSAPRTAFGAFASVRAQGEFLGRHDAVGAFAMVSHREARGVGRAGEFELVAIPPRSIARNAGCDDALGALRIDVRHFDELRDDVVAFLDKLTLVGDVLPAAGPAFDLEGCAWVDAVGGCFDDIRHMSAHEAFFTFGDIHAHAVARAGALDESHAPVAQVRHGFVSVGQPLYGEFFKHRFPHPSRACKMSYNNRHPFYVPL